MSQRHRRGKGEGSIRHRKDGRWEARVDLGYVNGRRRSKSLFATTRQEVAQKLNRALREQKLGLLNPGPGQTTGKYLAYWLESIARPSVRPSTFARYAGIVSLHLIPGLGRIRLDQLTPQHVQSMLNAKAGSLSPRTVAHLRAVLRDALNRAQAEGLIFRNPAEIARPPRVPRAAIEPLTPDQARRLMDAAEGDRWEALYVIALSLGLRQGEALGLRWQDVDLPQARLTVNYALQRVAGRLLLIEPKTTKSRRTIPLPGAVLEALSAHRRRQAEDRLLAGSRWQETGFVFTTAIGTPVDANRVRREFIRLLAGAGLPAIRFHDLRHSCASLLLAQGVSARVVMETLGHSQISLTMNTYTHVMPQAQQDAAAAMDRLLGGPA